MRLLIDTHAFSWFSFGDRKLPAKAKRLIEDPGNNVELSLASVWEKTIKHSLGKLPLDRPIKDFVIHETSANDIGIATIRPEHVFELMELPQTHQDPLIG